MTSIETQGFATTWRILSTFLGETNSYHPSSSGLEDGTSQAIDKSQTLSSFDLTKNSISSHLGLLGMKQNAANLMMKFDENWKKNYQKIIYIHAVRAQAFNVVYERILN